MKDPSGTNQELIEEISSLKRRIKDLEQPKLQRRQSDGVLQTPDATLLKVLNSLDSLVYVADMKSYEVIFINTYGKNIWGDAEGKICWQALQEGQTGPCEFCTNSQLTGPDRTPTEGVAWEFQNTVTKRWYDCRDKAIYWPDGRIVRVEIATDVTDHKQAETQLRQQTDAMDAAIDGIAILNEEEKYVYLNKAHATVYGYENTEELIGKSWRVLYDSDALQRFDQEIMPEFSREGSWHGEAIGMKKNGDKFSQEISLTAMANGGLICVVRDITDRKQVEKNLKDTLENLRKSFGVTIQVMVSATEARDPYTAGHQLRVADLARAIATEMRLSKDRIEGIRMAGSIHDIGKLSIPVEILSKPTKLSNIEFSLIKEHSQKGYEMLKDVESPWPLAEIVYQHHERMNGSGYPRNLKGDEILMEARIMAVADVVESMASHRPYRASLGISEALKEIEKNKGTLYDTNVVDACLRLFREKGFKFSEER